MKILHHKDDPKIYIGQQYRYTSLDAGSYSGAVFTITGLTDTTVSYIYEGLVRLLPPSMHTFNRVHLADFKKDVRNKIKVPIT